MSTQKLRTSDFEILIPPLRGAGAGERFKVSVPLKWDSELGEWLLTPEAHEIIETAKARRTGLLLPTQFKELRERYQFSQKQMGEVFQVGEKSWTRWESGKHRPSRSMNLLIRALYDAEISIDYLLERAGKPIREESSTAFTLHETHSPKRKHKSSVLRRGKPGARAGQ